MYCNIFSHSLQSAFCDVFSLICHSWLSDLHWILNFVVRQEREKFLDVLSYRMLKLKNDQSSPIWKSVCICYYVMSIICDMWCEKGSIKIEKKYSEYCIWLIFIAHNHWYSKKESKWGRILLNLTKSNVKRMDMSFSVTQPDYSSLWDRSVIIKKINDREHFFHGKRIVHKYLINDIVRMHVFLEKGLYGISRRIFMCFNFYIY